MCRFVAYLGHDILMEDVVVKPNNSIIRQSLHARESHFPTNGDGFGLGWYTPSISQTPGLFTSTLPAWNDRNLLHLTAKIKSNCFFAHVRAASTGGVNHYNCHPFIFKQWMFMHNGSIADFMPVKRHLRHLLNDDIYNWIKGETDSEHLFALFSQLAEGRDLSQMEVVVDTIRETIHVVNDLVKKYSKHRTSYFNFCLTDGTRLFASRYCSDKNSTPESLHYFSGMTFEPHRQLQNEDLKAKHHSVLIASEKLTDFTEEWESFPVNHLLLVADDLKMKVEPI